MLLIVVFQHRDYQSYFQCFQVFVNKSSSPMPLLTEETKLGGSNFFTCFLLIPPSDTAIFNLSGAVQLMPGIK